MAKHNLVLTWKVEQYINSSGSKRIDNKYKLTNKGISKEIGGIWIMFLMKQGQRFFTQWPAVPEVHEDHRKAIEGATHNPY